MSKESMPTAVFEYIMKMKDRNVREAYNEVRPGTLKRGRAREKK